MVSWFQTVPLPILVLIVNCGAYPLRSHTTKTLATSSQDVNFAFMSHTGKVVTATLFILVFVFAVVVHNNYDNSPLALLLAASNEGTFTTETDLGSVKQVNIRYCKSTSGRDHDYLIYEVVCVNRTLKFESPLSVPIWGEGYWIPNTPEKASEALKTNVEGWKTYYAGCLAGTPDPFGSVVQSVEVQRLDGAVTKNLLKWEKNGRIRFNLDVVYSSGIDKGQIKQTRVGFEIPIVPNTMKTDEPTVLITSIPIDADGIMRHKHLNNDWGHIGI